MRRLTRILAFLPALLAAEPAVALETSFHTYDGFGETVDAFRLVSMIFADPRYETLVLIIATVSIGIGALLASVRGSGMGLVAFGFQILVGVGLFVGLIATTGTVHVYDRVRNAYQPVGDVPNLLVLVWKPTALRAHWTPALELVWSLSAALSCSAAWQVGDGSGRWSRSWR